LPAKNAKKREKREEGLPANEENEFLFAPICAIRGQISFTFFAPFRVFRG
jgi:hypothetical protein